MSPDKARAVSTDERAKWRCRLLQTLLTVASLRARRMSWWI